MLESLRIIGEVSNLKAAFDSLLSQPDQSNADIKFEPINTFKVIKCLKSIRTIMNRYYKIKV
jgi:hypothetical protein